ncbi:MAG: DNA primase [Nitrosomonas sp.]|nr:MAG: DNA primase [Nitrosomonas sp.]
MVPQIFIHDLLNRIDIVDTIDRHVPLKKAGANFIACCPFHNEKTPSFTVSQSKQFYHCFGCGAHGNAINFLIEYSGLSFVEAVHDLAANLGLQVPMHQGHISSRDFDSNDFQHFFIDGNSPQNSEVSSQDLIVVLQIAAQYYRDKLKVSENAIAYLKERGLSGKTAARFVIGYAPAKWQNLEEVFPDYKSERVRKLLVKAGLVIVNDEAKQYDRFRDRIMFPIFNQKGQIVGFGGRVLEKAEPKYLNSPETVLFEKGRELYNLFSSRRAIRESNCVVVVEGYMDVIMLSQHGINYAVATLGTATTSLHIQKLLRQTDNIIFCFDGDKAGKKAAWRALENSLALISDGKHLSFLFLPEGEDPDSYVRNFGKESFEQKLKHAIPLSEFLLTQICLELNLQSLEGRAKLVHVAKPLLQQIKAPALSLILLNRLVELSGIQQNDLEELLQLKDTQRVRKTEALSRQTLISPYRRLIRALMYNPAYVTKLDRNFLVESNVNDEEVDALKVLIDFINMHPYLIKNNESAPSILTFLQGNSHRTLLENIESEILEWNNTIDFEAEFLGALEKIQLIHRNRRMNELRSKSLSKLTEEEKRELQKLAMS